MMNKMIKRFKSSENLLRQMKKFKLITSISLLKKIRIRFQESTLMMKLKNLRVILMITYFQVIKVSSPPV